MTDFAERASDLTNRHEEELTKRTPEEVERVREFMRVVAEADERFTEGTITTAQMAEMVDAARRELNPVGVERSIGAIAGSSSKDRIHDVLPPHVHTDEIGPNTQEGPRVEDDEIGIYDAGDPMHGEELSSGSPDEDTE